MGGRAHPPSARSCLLELGVVFFIEVANSLLFISRFVDHAIQPTDEGNMQAITDLVGGGVTESY